LFRPGWLTDGWDKDRKQTGNRPETDRKQRGNREERR
jgi:hypothetical protein